MRSNTLVFIASLFIGIKEYNSVCFILSRTGGDWETDKSKTIKIIDQCLKNEVWVCTLSPDS